jgi:hypothetical protein
MPRRRESSLHGRRLTARTTKQHRMQAVVESFEGLYEAVGEISGQEEHERFSLEARPGRTGTVIVSGYSHPRGDFELHGRLVEVAANKWDLTLEQVYTDSWNDKGYVFFAHRESLGPIMSVSLTRVPAAYVRHTAPRTLPSRSGVQSLSAMTGLAPT